MFELGWTSKFSLVHKEILRFSNVALAGLLNFSQSRGEKLYFQIAPNSLKQWEIGVFEVSIDFRFIRLRGLPLRHGMFVGERRGPNLRLNNQFSRKRNVHIYVIIFCQNAGNTVSKLK